MSEYHKIDSLFKRDMADKKKRLLIGQWTRPEFEYLANNRWVFTEKVDGTNIRIIVAKDGSVTYGGRTDNAQIPAQLVTRLNERFLPQQEQLAIIFPEGGVLYGEGYGAKIQKGGGNYREDQDFVLFDVRVGNWWLRRDDVLNIANTLRLDAVPVIGVGSLFDAIEMVKDNLRSIWGDFEAEGIVARPEVELQARNGSRIITKIKGCDFRQ